MKDLKILKSRSKQARIQFGGLYHKCLWRGKKNDYSLIVPELEVRIRTEDWSFFDWDLKLPSVVTTAIGRSSENKKDSQDVPDVPKAVCLRQWTGDLYSHNDFSAFLIKPAQAKWDSDSALRTLDSLAQKIVPYTSQIEIGSNNDPLYKFLNDNNFRQVSSYDRKLLLILHILMKSEPFHITPKYSGVNKFTEAQKDEPYVRTINDVFSSFALLCEMLLDDAENDLAEKRSAETGQSQQAQPPSETEVERISELIEKLKALKGAKEEYDRYREGHDKSHLGLSPDSTQKALWLEAQQLIDEIELDLVGLWEHILDCTIPEDNFGGWVVPTGTSRQNVSRDIMYALNSKEPDLMHPLIQQFKKIRRRLEIKSQQEQESAEIEQDPISPHEKGKPGRKIDPNRDKDAKELMELYDKGKQTWDQVGHTKGITGQAAQQKVRRYKARLKNKKNTKSTAK